MANGRSDGHDVSGAELASVLGQAQAVLFDFDGPICSIFAGYPAPVIARELRDHLAELGSNIPETDDPLEVLRLSVPSGQRIVAEIEDLLVAAERAAALSASPTPGGMESIEACIASGRTAAIVSNNSAAAVCSYLDHHGSPLLVAELIVGREYANPQLMKPHPAPMLSVLAAAGVRPPEAVLIGDSTTDVEVAIAVGVPCIGFANKPGKRETLSAATVVIDDMRVLAEQLAAVPSRGKTR